MAIFTKNLIKYFKKLYSEKKSFHSFDDDPILSLAKICITDPVSNNPHLHSFDLIDSARDLYSECGFIGIVKSYFGGSVTDTFANSEEERKLYILKKGLNAQRFGEF